MNPLHAKATKFARLARALVWGALAMLLIGGGISGWRHLSWPRPSESVRLAADIAGRKCVLVSEVFLPPPHGHGPRRLASVTLPVHFSSNVLKELRLCTVSSS